MVDNPIQHCTFKQLVQITSHIKVPHSDRRKYSQTEQKSVHNMVTGLHINDPRWSIITRDTQTRQTGCE